MGSYFFIDPAGPYEILGDQDVRDRDSRAVGEIDPQGLEDAAANLDVGCVGDVKSAAGVHEMKTQERRARRVDIVQGEKIHTRTLAVGLQARIVRCRRPQLVSSADDHQPFGYGSIAIVRVRRFQVDGVAIQSGGNGGGEALVAIRTSRGEYRNIVHAQDAGLGGGACQQQRSGQ